MSAVQPMPVGFSIVLDPSTRRLAPDVLFGGSPTRAMHLSAAGCRALAELEAGPIVSVAAAQLARRLTDAGLAHPRPPVDPPVVEEGRAAARLETTATDSLDVTVLIPVRDRAAELRRCLSALGDAYPVVVVDDGSHDPEAVAKVAADHGARLVVRAANGGPAAARNTGFAEITTDFVAMLDSDCVPEAGWIERLAAHLQDPLVAVAAPRIAAAETSATVAGRFAELRGVLDLGADEARVQPLSRVAYVPSAALVARVAALRAVALDGQSVFDESMRSGEDVDLVWRLDKAGWRVRYDARVRVTHHEPDRWRVLLARRFRYGTSAGPLAERHPAAMPPMIVNAWPAAAVAALLLGRPTLAAAAAVGAYRKTDRALTAARVPRDPSRTARMAAASTAQSWLSAGRFSTQLLAPALLIALARKSTRLGALSLLLGPAFVNWAKSRRTGQRLDPARFALAHLADDIVYGAGVWTGAVRSRTTVPLVPLGAGRASTNLRRDHHNG